MCDQKQILSDLAHYLISEDMKACEINITETLTALHLQMKGKKREHNSSFMCW